MKNKIMLGLVSIFAIILVGCASTYKAYIYEVGTGDKIKIKLDTSDEYDIASEIPFTISKDGSTLSQGTFITLDGYDQYIDVVNKDTNSTILDSGNKNGVEYIFYSYNNSEYNYIIKINNSNTGVILANAVSKESAEECFNRLTFSKE